MKALLFLLALTQFCYSAKSQQTISGTVTYGYYWADTGAIIYLFDARQISKPVLQLIEAKAAAESEECRQLQQRRTLTGRQRRLHSYAERCIIMNKEEEATAFADSERSIIRAIQTMDEALLRFDPRKTWDSLEQLAYNPASPLFSDQRARVMQTRANGTYSFNLPQPGVYYILIRPLNERATVATGTSVHYKYFLKKLTISEGGTGEANTAFRL